MPRETKGQQVKSFKDEIPQPNQQMAPAVTKVYFKADAGKFRIFLPEHIAAVVKSGVDELFNGNAFDGEPRVEAEAINDVLEAWTQVKDRYLAILRQEGAVKVIRYRFQAKHRDLPTFGDEFWRFDHGQMLASGPAMLLDYEILWRSGSRLYYGHYAGDELHLQDKGPAPSANSPWMRDRVIEWTEEREAFFKKMQAALVSLIDQLIDFLDVDAIEGNIAALAAGERTLLLAAPEKTPTAA